MVLFCMLAEDAKMFLLFLALHPNAVVGGDLLAGAAQGAARTTFAAVVLPRSAPISSDQSKENEMAGSAGRDVTLAPYMISHYCSIS